MRVSLNIKYSLIFVLQFKNNETHLWIRGECCKDDIKDPGQQTHCRRLVWESWWCQIWGLPPSHCRRCYLSNCAGKAGTSEPHKEGKMHKISKVCLWFSALPLSSNNQSDRPSTICTGLSEQLLAWNLRFTFLLMIQHLPIETVILYFIHENSRK